jgi:hypothetical protein
MRILEKPFSASDVTRVVAVLTTSRAMADWAWDAATGTSTALR